MNGTRFLNFLITTVLVFSLWVAFALLAINPYLHPYIPGYEVGKPCGWEFVALAISALIAFRWTRDWVTLAPRVENGVRYSSVATSLVIFLMFYMIVAIIIFAWQYAIFSAGYQ